MKRVWPVVGLLVAVGQAGAARPAVFACPTIAIAPIAVSINDQFGRDAALNTSVTWTRTGPAPAWVRRQSKLLEGLGGGSVQVTGADDYTVMVRKAWYVTETRVNVPVALGRCGTVRPTLVSVVLKLKPGAPRLRSVILQTRQNYTGYVPVGRPQWARLAAFVDANPGVDTAVTWTSSNPAVATVDQTGYVRAALCHAAPARVTITASSKADPKVAQRLDLSFGRSSARCPKS